jgi:hypothetical protein
MNNDLSNIDFRKRGEAYRLALTYTEKMAACISASIDACDHEDIERANHFSKMALRHAMQAENYLASAAT